MTAQIHERLQFDGETYGMANEPLRQYFAKNEIDIRLNAPSTACWRGYFGEWEVVDNKLYLTKLKGSGVIKDKEKYRAEKLALRRKLKEGLITPIENGKLLKLMEKECWNAIQLSLNSLFQSEEKVFACWYSGTIRAPFGELIEYIHDGYESIFEYELLIDFKEGVVVNIWEKQN